MENMQIDKLCIRYRYPNISILASNSEQQHRVNGFQELFFFNVCVCVPINIRIYLGS